MSTNCALRLPDVSAAFVAMQNVNSEKSVTVDGEKLENGKEKKLGIGMKILFGDDTEYQVQHMPSTLYAHKQSVFVSDCKHTRVCFGHACQWNCQTCGTPNFFVELTKACRLGLLQVLRNVRTHA